MSQKVVGNFPLRASAMTENVVTTYYHIIHTVLNNSYSVLDLSVGE